jgi:N-acetylmuramic acid 6-phosphate etherase
MDHLETEARNPASTKLDELTALEIVRLMNAEDAKVIPAVASQAEAIARAINVIADRLAAGGRLVYVGAGTSGRLGVLDATECPPTFSTPPGQVVGLIAGGPAAVTASVEGAEDHPELAERDLAVIGFSACDVLVGIATSGRTPYVLGAITYARKLSTFTIGLSCNADSDLIPEVDLAITPIVGPEVLSGSTRLKAGTATKLVLNMMTTGAMVRLGKCFGNLMVDLKASNNKLKARANRIVRLLTGLNHEDANDLLARSNGELKTAIVSQLAGVSPDEARRRISTSGGRVRAAVGAVVDAVPRHVLPRGETSIPLSQCVLGIDGGGTHTVALFAIVAPSNPPHATTDHAQLTTDRFSILGRGESGPSNLQAIGQQRAFRAIDEAVENAFCAAGIERCLVQVVWLGIAGAGRSEDQALIRDWAIRNKLAAHVEVSHDAPLLLAAGTPDGWGVAVVAGTGSIAFARAPDGRTSRAGGWGYLLGDEGSGYALGMAALQAVTRAADGRGPETVLAKQLLDRLKLRCPEELVAAIYQNGLDRPAIAALATLVIDAADVGDQVAAAIVQEGTEQLALAAATIARQLALPSPLPLALAGGLLLASKSYRERLLKALRALEITTGKVELVPEPAHGAVRLALRRFDHAQQKI